MNNQELLILGASSDFGQELIKRIHCDYDRIFAHYCNGSEKLYSLKDKIGEKLKCYHADFGIENDIIEMLEAIESEGGHPTHIVHLPSIPCEPEKFHKMTWNQFQMRLNISLRSFILVLQKFLPHMIKNKNGKIVVMASSYTNSIPPRYLSDYITEKYALVGLVKALATEYANKKIQFNLVSPEMTNTKFLNAMPELIIEQNAMKSPKKSNLSIEDVIPTLTFLLSPGANQITGENIVISGGK